jgi:glutathione S-transferase
MDFYFGKMSGNSLRVAYALHEAGAPFTPHLLDARGGENRTAAYRAINPMGKIPSLVDGGFNLWESNAINLYVAEKFPRAGLLPDSLGGRAGVHRWLFFQAVHVSPAARPIFTVLHVALRAYWGFPADLSGVEPARRELARYITVLDGALERREWLEGTFSLADIAYAPHLWLLEESGFDFGPWPSMRGWYQRLIARPAWQEARALVFG